MIGGPMSDVKTAPRNRADLEDSGLYFNRELS